MSPPISLVVQTPFSFSLYKLFFAGPLRAFVRVSIVSPCILYSEHIMYIARDHAHAYTHTHTHTERERERFYAPKVPCPPFIRRRRLRYLYIFSRDATVTVRTVGAKQQSLSWRRTKKMEGIIHPPREEELELVTLIQTVHLQKKDSHEVHVAGMGVLQCRR